MDGFTLIPKKQKIDPVANASDLQSPNYEVKPENSYNPNKIMESTDNIRLAMDNGALPVGISEDVVTEEPDKSSILDSSLPLLISILALLGAIAYCGYLFFMRQIYIAQIEDYSLKIKALENKISATEIQELQNIDQVLKSLKGRIDKHVLATQVFTFINRNMRSSLQLTEYKIDSDQDGGIAIYFSCVAPEFKDLAQQTEKMVELQKSKFIKSFMISNLSYEQDTSKVRFTIKVSFDKRYLVAGNINSNNK